MRNGENDSERGVSGENIRVRCMWGVVWSLDWGSHQFPSMRKTDARTLPGAPSLLWVRVRGELGGGRKVVRMVRWGCEVEGKVSGRRDVFSSPFVSSPQGKQRRVRVISKGRHL
jgi:hypothetical protein